MLYRQNKNYISKNEINLKSVTKMRSPNKTICGFRGNCLLLTQTSPEMDQRISPNPIICHTIYYSI